MSMRRRMKGAGLRRGLRSGGSSSFVFPASTLLIYDGIHTYARTVSSSPDVDALINLRKPGTWNISQSTASKKPHETLSNPVNINFDNSTSNILLNNTGGTLIPAESEVCLWAVVDISAMVSATTGSILHTAPTATPAHTSFTYRGFAQFFDSQFVTKNNGTVIASVSYAPTGYNVLRSRLTKEYVSAAIDGVETKTASAGNGGNITAYNAVSLGASITDSSYMDGLFRYAVVCLNPTDQDVLKVDNFLASLLP